MKISLELPAWCKDRTIYILAGIEAVAFKQAGEPIQVKTQRCNGCGTCCQISKTENCKDLVPDGNKFVCGLGVLRPFACCVDGKSLPECSVKYEMVK